MQVKGILEEYRIGRLKGGATAQVADPYANEPQRLPALIVRSQKPMNSGGRPPRPRRRLDTLQAVPPLWCRQCGC